MRFIYIVFCLGILLFSSCQQKASFQDELAAVAAQNQLVGMSLLVVCNGDIVDEFYHGLAHIEEERPVTEKTRYRIASISKTVVATGLMKLYEKGAFDLDDDISPVLGYPVRNRHFPEVPITFRMLLTHTSSLQDGSGYGDFLFTTYRRDTLPGMEEILLPEGYFYTDDMWLSQKPGTYFTYCNLNFGIIGALIEKISGKRFDIYIRETVLEPLGIEGSFNVREITDLNSIAALYRNGQSTADDYQGVYPEPLTPSYPLGQNGSIFGPQGSLRVSPRELATFMLMHMQQTSGSPRAVLDKGTVELMQQPVWTFDGSNGDTYGGFYHSFGLSLHRTGQADRSDFIFPNVPMIGHAGEAYGLISQMHWDTSGRFGFIWMTNGYYGEQGHEAGIRSAFFKPEEAIFNLIESYYHTCMAK